jgi:copper transport protein
METGGIDMQARLKWPWGLAQNATGKNAGRLAATAATKDLGGRLLLLCIVILTVAALLCSMPDKALASSGSAGAAEQLAAAPQSPALETYVALHNHNQSGKPGAESPSLGSMAVSAALIVSRAAFYFATLLAAGLPFLTILFRRGDEQRPLLRRLDSLRQTSIKALLLATLTYIFLHSITIAQSVGGGDNWLRVFTETSLGKVWIAQLVLALLGFFALSLATPGRIVWAAGLLVTESLNGHAAAAELKTAAIGFDFVHLLCSSLWASGVIALLVLWRKERKETGHFAERFAGIAWLTILLLVISGIGMIILLAPSWHYLLYTSWGQWLIAKACLVVAVAATGYALRRRAKARLMPRGSLLKLDGFLMASIITIASLFTFIGPASSGEPYKHHQMGESFHYTLEVTPNAAGPNKAELIVWLPETDGKPQEISLTFQGGRYSGDKAVTAKLKELPAPASHLEFPGFTAFYYESESFVLPVPTGWSASLEVLTLEGERIQRSADLDNNEQ